MLKSDTQKACSFLAVMSAVIAISTITISVYAATPEYLVVRERDAAIVIDVVDEQGHPVPFAEVWRVVTPRVRPGLFPSTQGPDLSLEYLDRVAGRYRDVPEFAGSFRPGFFPAHVDSIGSGRAFDTLTPTNEDGRTQEVLKYETVRPALIKAKYVALNFGFVPGFVSFDLHPGENTHSEKIVLKRDQSIKSPSAPYVYIFGRIRRDSDGNSDRYKDDPESYRNELIEAAKAAERAGDFTYAARIYSWVPYVPTVIKFENTTNGIRTAGFTREDERSQRNIDILNKAREIDPTSIYIQMKQLLLVPPQNNQERIKALEKLISKGKNQMWPGVFKALEAYYNAAGDKEHAYQMLKSYREFEPEDPVNQTDQYETRLTKYLSVKEFIQRHVAAGDPDQSDQYRHPPIYYAVRAGRVDIFDWLLEHGIKTPLPSYVLMQATLSRSPEMLRRVLGTDPAITGIKSTWNFAPQIFQLDEFIKNGLPDEVAKLTEMKENLRAYSANRAN
ncbi:hypothetical protein ACO0KY_07805 [Undibacterium sp. Dicai25W]|uniref:hypothetical protein n=1 Tax=Undibacterium sp. Dicai25W TaxID=3413034 RepID=UPI003BF2BF64